MARINVRAVVVLNRDGSLAGVVSDSMLLRMLLPPYVEEAQGLAGVLGEKAAEELWRRLEGKTAQNLIPAGQRSATIDADDTLIEVAVVMVRTRAPVVAVRQGNRISGVVTIEDLLAQLMNPR
jgi:CBS domain-containing protein